MRTAIARWRDNWRLHAHLRDALRLLAALGALMLLLAGWLVPAHADLAPPTACGAGGIATDQYGLARTAPGAPGAAAPASSPTISVDRVSGGVGTLVHVQGSGWIAGETISLWVQYAQAGAGFVDANGPLDSETVAADGTFTAQPFRLPPDACNRTPAPGTAARIAARGSASNAAHGGPDSVGYAPIAIVAAPTITVQPAPTQVVAGTTGLSVVGHGWGAGTIVAVSLGHWVDGGAVQPTLVAALPEAQGVLVTAGNDGGFATGVPVSSSIRWGTVLQVVAAADTPAFGDLARLDTSFAAPLLPSQVPSLAVNPASGNSGDPLTIQGKHWWPNDTLTLAVCKAAPCSPQNQGLAIMGTAVVDASGAFTVQVHVPHKLEGFPTVSVLAFTSDYDPTIRPFFLRSTPYRVLANARSALAASSPVPSSILALHFDLGAVLGLIMLVLVLVILAEPAGRWWKAHVGD